MLLYGLGIFGASISENRQDVFTPDVKSKNGHPKHTVAETYAAVKATKDIVCFRNLFKDLGFEQIEPTSLYVDNKSLITLAQKFSENHFLARINYIIDQVDNLVVRLEHLIGTSRQADTLTKHVRTLNKARNLSWVPNAEGLSYQSSRTTS